MKVYLNPSFDKEDKGEGGIRRVVEAQKKYLPDYGIEFVKDIDKADIVNCHGTSINDVDNLVLSIHGLYWEGYEWPKWYRNANSLILTGMKRAKVVTAPSEWVANAVRRGMLVDPVVCYHGITIEDWTPQENRGYVLWNKNRVDAICDPKDVGFLARNMPNTEFISTFGDNEPNVTLTGKVPFFQMKEYIQQAGVYLATSRETLGVGTLEAMAAGVPVLGWNFGGQQEIVDHKETGYLATSPQDLLDGLHYCLEHRKRLGTNARQTIIERWQWKDVISSYAQAYTRALSKLQSGPTVSVILTAYNLDEYLEDAIRSVIDQKFTDWELIIVDDHSPDTCGQIADRWAEKDKRIKVIHNKTNVYLAEARNIGIRASTGKYIMPLDADDMLGDDALGRLVRSIQEPEVDIVTGSMELIEEDGRHWVSSWPHAKSVGYEEQIKKHNQIPYASLYVREAWERTGGYRRRCRSAEDADFWTRIFSYGFNPKKTTQAPTLIYRNRSNSMSHIESEPDWISWFTWSKLPDRAPYPHGPIWIYGPPDISVIIPVGPGHEIYLQDSLDSLVAQTLLNWEVIVVNDTGKSLQNSPYLAGFPFVHLVDDLNRKGTAKSRNLGTKNAHSNLIVALDADDYAQPQMLEILYKAYQQRGGWVYCDWFADNGHEIWRQNAIGWDAKSLPFQMLGSGTILYTKSDWAAVGGYDETIEGWEDWEFQINLLEHDLPGIRVAHPLFTYRYRLGSNRENDFANKENLLNYIQEKHPKLYGGNYMPCSGCSKRSDIIVSSNNKVTADNEELVEIEYIGGAPNKRIVPSKVKRGHTMQYSSNPRDRRFMCYKQEADRFLMRPNEFRLVQVAEDMPMVDDHPAVVAERAVKLERSIEDLGLSETIITLLKKNNIETENELMLTSDAALLAINGIGSLRLKEIRDTFHA